MSKTGPMHHRDQAVVWRNSAATMLLLLLLAPFLAGAAGHAHDKPAHEQSDSHQPYLDLAAPANVNALTDPPGLAAGSRKGLPFTKKGRVIVKEDNAARHGGKNHCETCGVETVPGKQHKKGVTPPNNETQVDHVIPKAEGGRGDPDNGQVLCRECNIEKSDKMPQAPEGGGP